MYKQIITLNNYIKYITMEMSFSCPHETTPSRLEHLTYKLEQHLINQHHQKLQSSKTDMHIQFMLLLSVGLQIATVN